MIGWGGTITDWLDNPRALLTAAELIEDYNRRSKR